MLNRAIFRLISLPLIFALLSGPTSHNADAQDPPRPSEPKRPSPQADARDKKAEKPQGAQADEQAPDRGAVIKLDTDLVLLDVTVIDQNNMSVMNLKKEDFTVYEDKAKQTVESVSREEVPVSFGMVIDTSGSMRSKLDTVSDAAVSLVRQMHVDDEAFVSSFKAEPELVQDFTSDRRELEDAIGDLYTSGGTALLDAIIATSEYAHDKGKRRRKALVIFSDGLERNSSVKEKEVMEAIKENEVQVYLVGFIDEEMEDNKSAFGKSPAKKARDLLSLIADDSGGRAFFPKDISEIPAIAAQIAKDLRTQYVVSYYPTNDKLDGAFRTVQVTVNSQGSRKLIARTRRGYYSRNEKGRAPAATQKKFRGD
ncbi:MAG: VWA domain-containing protein [Blastocatellia bacterium]|nr:VWA domain-containing protein [Blastocatellia bacterium]